MEKYILIKKSKRMFVIGKLVSIGEKVLVAHNPLQYEENVIQYQIITANLRYGTALIMLSELRKTDFVSKSLEQFLIEKDNI